MFSYFRKKSYRDLSERIKNILLSTEPKNKIQIFILVQVFRNTLFTSMFRLLGKDFNNYHTFPPKVLESLLDSIEKVRLKFDEDTNYLINLDKDYFSREFLTDHKNNCKFAVFIWGVIFISFICPETKLTAEIVWDTLKKNSEGKKFENKELNNAIDKLFNIKKAIETNPSFSKDSRKLSITLLPEKNNIYEYCKYEPQIGLN